MKTLDEQITDAENALEQAKTSGDSGAQAKAEGCLEGLKNAKEFHAKEFERVGKKIRSEGGEAKEKEIAEALGVTLEEAKQIVEDHKTTQELIETETERARKAKETAEKERDDAKALADSNSKLANERLIKAELKLELITEGARKDRLAKILRDADLSGVEIEDEEVKNLSPVVTALKEEYPEWFGDPSSFARIPSSGRRSEKKREPGSFVESWQERENKRMGLK